ncbi:MAG: SAF domain-containing protein, partial [Prochlorothrix sp.]
RYGATTAEQKSLKFRRSLYIAQAMKAGETLTPQNIKAIRPGHGLPPKYYEILLGKTIKQDAPAGTPLSWDIIT